MAGFAKVGLDGRAICAHAGLDYAVMSNSAAHVSNDDFAQLWLAAAELSDDPRFALRAGMTTLTPTNHIVGALAISGHTFGEGVRTAVRYARLLAEGPWFQIEELETEARLLFPFLGRGLSSHAEFTMATAQSVLDVTSEGQGVAKEIWFRHSDDGGGEEIRRFFRCPVLFDQDCAAFVVSKETWDRPVRDWDPVWKRQLELCATEIEAAIQPVGFACSVRTVVQQLLPEGRCDIQHTTKRLAMSERTLQRRLKEEGTTFRDLVDSSRLAIVRRGRAHGLPDGEIIRRAGFSDRRAYRRAIQRWEARGVPALPPVPAE